MTENRDEGASAPLNPDLKKRHDEIYNTEHSKSPLETTHAHEGSQGEGWSWIWLIVTIVSVALAIYFLL